MYSFFFIFVPAASILPFWPLISSLTFIFLHILSHFFSFSLFLLPLLIVPLKWHRRSPWREGGGLFLFSNFPWFNPSDKRRSSRVSASLSSDLYLLSAEPVEFWIQTQVLSMKEQHGNPHLHRRAGVVSAPGQLRVPSGDHPRFHQVWLLAVKFVPINSLHILDLQKCHLHICS